MASKSSQDEVVALICVDIVKAQNLPKMDVGFMKADPYVILKFGHEFHTKTKTIYNNLNPQWDEHFRFLVRSSQSKYHLCLEVFDKDAGTEDDFIGVAEVPVEEFINKFEPKELTLFLADPKKLHKHHHDTLGSLTIKVTPLNKASVEKHFWTDFASMFDADRNQCLSYTELVGLLAQIGSNADEKQTSELFSRGDTNHDNVLSFDEFYELMSTDSKNLHKNPILEKILPEGSSDFIWHIATELGQANKLDVSDIMMKRGFYGTVTKKEDKTQILIHNRKTGILEEELIPPMILGALKMLYQTGKGKFAIDKLKIGKILKHVTEQQKKKMTSPQSKLDIPEFIKTYNLNLDEVKLPLEKFENFNEFFYRELKEGARPVHSPTNPKVAVSPADCRLNVFETISDATNIWVKGKNFTLQGVFGDEKLAKEFDGGSLVIARLAPQDYHRFHSPVDGKLIDYIDFPGHYYTVNPMAVREMDVYTENRRCILVIESPEYGKVLFVAVGATMVGSINWARKKGETVKKGDELGYFAFGGSTVLLFFGKGTIKLDDDLVINSKKPVETLIAVGDSLGKCLL